MLYASKWAINGYCVFYAHLFNKENVASFPLYQYKNQIQNWFRWYTFAAVACVIWTYRLLWKRSRNRSLGLSRMHLFPTNFGEPRKWVFRKVLLHGTIRNDDFQRITEFNCWNNIAAIRNNVTTML